MYIKLCYGSLLFSVPRFSVLSLCNKTGLSKDIGKGPFLAKIHRLFGNENYTGGGNHLSLDGGYIWTLLYTHKYSHW